MRRLVEAELLDILPPKDVNACRSREDLQRLNWLMGHAKQLARQFSEIEQPLDESKPLRIVELGAGDGTFCLQLAKILARVGILGEVTLVDRQDAVVESTREAFRELDWKVNVNISDVFCWLKSDKSPADLVFCNLFLHHFEEGSLKGIFEGITAQTSLFMACEPRRAPLALAACHFLRFIGCNSVTRHDAKASVRAGFQGEELSSLWPKYNGWQLTETRSGLFSHFFLAQMNGK